MNDTSLRQILDVYVRSWGPIDWSSLRNHEPIPSEAKFAPVILALALVEGDFEIIRRKLAATHTDRDEILQEFITIWVAEEGEHSRALKRMAQLFGATEMACDRHRTLRDWRAFVAWPILHLGRLVPGLSAAYCTLGAIQECIAITTYCYLADVIQDLECKQILKQIAVQEARHMRFYRNAAKILLSNSRIWQISTAILIRQLWRPPGMDLLGPRSFTKIFAPLLSDLRYTDALKAVDRVISDLPGLNNVKVMTKFLREVALVPA